MNLKRPPIVTVLGHVDHGKTTLLDTIRKTNIAAREAGGITQSIGASKIETLVGEFTFIDTPGHAAFSAMRGRGVEACDLAILIVSAADGVMPQTKEAIKLIVNAKIPYIVAVTKTDLPTANTERVLGQLSENGVFLEGRGGEVPYIEISAKTGKNINELLELIALVLEVHGIKGTKEERLLGVVIETNKDKEGALVSAVIKSGSVKPGDTISSSGQEIRVRGLFDQYKKPVKEVFAGDPVVILGFNALPEVGAPIFKPLEGHIHFETKEKDIQELEAEKMRIVLKAKTRGSLDALIHSMPSGVLVFEKSVGEVTESDVFVAKNSGARIIVFESKVPPSVLKLSESEHVKIDSFQIIYELIGFLEKIILEGETVVLGKASVLAIFPYENKKVAGVRILSGKISVKDTVILSRDEKEIGKVKVVSIRKLKDQIQEAKEGQECGIIFDPQIDFQVKDVLTAVKI